MGARVMVQATRLGVAGALAAVVVWAATCGPDGARPGGRAARPPLVVSAASSLKTAFTGYAESFAPADARFSFAGSDELAAQIRRGVLPDVFASADLELPHALHDEGLVEEPVVFAANRLVLAVPAGSDVDGLEDLAGGDVKLAVGSGSVPVGVYTRELLARLPPHLEQRLLARVRSSEPNVAGVVGKIAQRAVDAGFVYATDVAAADGALRAVALPAALRPRVAYAAAVVRGARHPAAARAFVHGLLGGAGRAALRRAGFEPPPGQ